MEKRASNTFIAGLNTDRHPLTSQNTELIEARNVELITVGEGYQLVLQKREGNAELRIIPTVWDNTVTYYTNEYVTYEGFAYKSISDENTGNIPSEVPIPPILSKWESLAMTTVPAGLPDEYIPLAVKEFNNVAYIVSVDPTANPPVGEIGTFPSPDYSKFVYTSGETFSPGATIPNPDGIYDGTMDSPEYGFTSLPELSATVEYVSGITAVETELVYSNFTITNIGSLPDSYSLILSDATGLTMWVNVNNTSYAEYNPLSKPTLSYLDTCDVQLRVTDPSAFTTPGATVTPVIDIEPVNGPISGAKTFSCKFNVTIVITMQRFGTPFSAAGFDMVTLYQPSIVNNPMPAEVDTYGLIWRSNDSGMVMLPETVDHPAQRWVPADDTDWSSEISRTGDTPGSTIEVLISRNNTGTTREVRYTYSFTATTGGTYTYQIFFNQLFT